jgi:hypothetical protein
MVRGSEVIFCSLNDAIIPTATCNRRLEVAQIHWEWFETQRETMSRDAALSSPSAEPLLSLPLKMQQKGLNLPASCKATLTVSKYIIHFDRLSAWTGSAWNNQSNNFQLHIRARAFGQEEQKRSFIRNSCAS